MCLYALCCAHTPCVVWPTQWVAECTRIKAISRSSCLQGSIENNTPHSLYRSQNKSTTNVQQRWCTCTIHGKHTSRHYRGLLHHFLRLQDVLSLPALQHHCQELMAQVVNPCQKQDMSNNEWLYTTYGIEQRKVHVRCAWWLHKKFRRNPTKDKHIIIHAHA